MTADLAELLARVEGAEGGDRELDVAIWLGTVNPAETGLGGLTLAEAVAKYPEDLQGIANHWAPSPLPKVTASLDAAVALAERVLGAEYAWSVTHAPPWLGGPSFCASLSNGIWRETSVSGITPAIALLAAVLRALIAQAESPQSSEEQPLGCVGEAELSTLPGMNQEDAALRDAQRLMGERWP